MAAAMLGALGVYIGPECAAVPGALLGAPGAECRLNGYAEAATFFRLNEMLLRGARATWSRVDPFLHKRDRPAFRTLAQLALQRATYGSLLDSFLSPVPAAYSGPWGWKDPRNSVTLPLWLDLFPDARVIHVRRDPEAVVASLHRRALHWAQSGTPSPSTLSAVARIKANARRLGILPALPPDPCLDPAYCRYLCSAYVAECNRAMRLSRAYLELHYEDVLQDPAAAARKLALMAECTPSPDQFRAAVEIVHCNRTG